MESEGGGIVATTTPTTRRLSSQNSTLRVSFNSNNDIPNGLKSDTTGPQPISNLTLGAVLNGVKASPPSPTKVVIKTLLEVIRNEDTLTSGGLGSPNNKKTWKSFKEKLTRKKGQKASSSSHRWESSMPVPQSDVLPSSRSLSNRSSSLRNSSMRRVDSVPLDGISIMEVDSGGSPRSGGSFRLSAALAAEKEETRRRLSREFDEDGNEKTPKKDDSDDEDEDEDEEDDDGMPNFGAPAQPMKMSLMDLLEETDRQAGIDGPTYRLDDDEEEEEYDDEEEEEEEEAAEEEVGKGGEYTCCVCMVKHKGSAFIPCGHAFCRMCSKELFVQKGNCPLCNNFILEILDIF